MTTQDQIKASLAQDKPATGKVNLMGFDRAAMEAYFLSIGEKTFRASQVMKWIHQTGANDFTQMTNLSKALRASLAETAEITLPDIISDNLSEDGAALYVCRRKSVVLLIARSVRLVSKAIIVI